ncbi:MAG: 5'-nucleotidase C-terminal domain-containing protein, partial [Planctomycetes bacterium]|nr:5'-nucleotidase C-terminal domain-containing protein [Planctomycetota bacterium]
MTPPAILRRPVWLLAAALLVPALRADEVTITILHTNDLHAHVEPVVVKSKSYGGYARHVTLVSRFRESDPNVLILSGGDTFQGTLYFHVYQGLADLFFLHQMGYDGMAVGNHEFDRGPAALGVFAANARFPVLAANLDVSREPSLAGLVRPHAVVEVGGTRVGLVGAVTPELPRVSSPGESVKMKDVAESIAASIATLDADGVSIVILLSHLGYHAEQDLASKVAGIDLVVGGHSHTFLGDTGDANLPAGEGPYPTVVERPGGDRTLLVSAGEWGIELGRIQVIFDDSGRVARWQEARPIVVGESVPEDPLARSAVLALSAPIEAMRKVVICEIEAGLDADREAVRRRECPLGNAVADAMLDAAARTEAQIAIVNGGGIRDSLKAGPVTYEDLVRVQPFTNTLVVLELTGAELRTALEHGVSGWDDATGGFLHVSRGTAYEFDLARPPGERIVSVTLGGKPIDPAAIYRVAMTSFLAAGGDGFDVLAGAKGYR